jgi:hypothetical protein
MRWRARWPHSASASPSSNRIEAYDGTPAAEIRRILTERTTEGIGDPALMAAAMIASVDQDPAPRRLVLGSDAYRAIEYALNARLADVRTQRESAEATDAPLEGGTTGGSANLDA